MSLADDHWKNGDLTAAIEAAVEELARAADVTSHAERKLLSLLKMAGADWRDPKICLAHEIAVEVVRRHRTLQRKRACERAARRVGSPRSRARRA